MSLTCDQLLSLSRLSVTNQCHPVANESRDIICSLLSGMSRGFMTTNHGSREGGGEGGGLAPPPRPRRVCTLKSIDVNEPGWHEERLSIM